MPSYQSEIGLINEANGSARFQSGETIVLASVYGPSQPRYLRHEELDKATLEVNYSIAALPGGGGWLSNNADTIRSEREGARIIRQSLLSCIDLNASPRMLIVINVTVQRNDGSTLSTAINACSLALIDSGIPMLYFPMSISYAYTNKENEVDPPGIMNPSWASESKACSSVVFVLRNSASEATPQQQPAFSMVMARAVGIIGDTQLDTAWREVAVEAASLRTFFGKVIRG